MLKQDEKSFPFLRLPGEVRNQVYWDVLEWDVDRWNGPRLLDQPAITRVSRRTRAEALQLYYHFSCLKVKTSCSEEWVPFVHKVLNAFNGEPRGLPGGSQSTLRLLRGLDVDFLTEVPGVHIEVRLEHNTDYAMNTEADDDCEVVVVGSSDMDWTDAAAVQAACDKAARQLADDITRRTTPDEEDVELVAASTPADQRAAVEALRLFALACPYMCLSVCICDSSDIEIYEATDGDSTNGDSADEYPDGYEDPGDPTIEDTLDELYFIMNGN